MVNPEDFIRDQLPFQYWPVVPTVLRQAYAAADSLIDDSPILQVNSARDNKGRSVSWAVDFGFQRAVVSGALNCECRWVPFAQPTGRYLELRFSHSKASISQIADPSKQPRTVVFRENAKLTTQTAFDFEQFREEQRVLGLPHFLIVHGHQQLAFAHIGLPSPTARDWAWLSRNLMSMPHEIPADNRPAPENTDTDFASVNLLKEELERWMRDNVKE